MTTRVERARQLARKGVREARDKNRWRRIVRVRLWMPVVLQVLLVVGLAWYTESRFPGFISATNVTQILILALPLIVAAFAQTHALLVGYIDLSVGAMISLGVVVASFLIGAEATLVEIGLGIGAIFLCAVALGLVNAGLIRGAKIPSIIATLATLSILDGISLTLRPSAQGVISGDLVAWLTASIGPIPIAFLVVVAGAGLLDVWLHASGSGLQVRAVGFDERSAKRSGISTNWVRVRALILCSVLAAAASFLVMARSPIGNAQIGSTFALSSITAAVLGGASLAGGRATFLGGLVAAILLALILTVLPYLGLSNSDGLMIIGILVLVGIILFQFGDLKELVKRNYKRARRLMVGSRLAPVAELPAFYPAGTEFAVPPTGRKLVRGGTVLSLDKDVGDFAVGDVLIEGDQIVAVGPGLEAAGAEEIDASGMIVMPGFVDSHRHIWEGLLRNIGTDVPLEGRTSYISFVLHRLAPAFRPEDAYVGNLVSALGAIDAGITTLLDWSHIQGSPAHTDAVIQALEDSGLRGVFAYGFPWWGKWEERQPSWFVRAATEHFSTKDQMLTLALAAPGPEFTDFEVSRDHWKLARETGARITTHVGVGSYGQDAKVQRFGEAGLLGPGHHLHPLHHAQRRRDPDDRGHRGDGVARLPRGDDDGPRDAADPEVPRPRAEAQPQRRRGDQRPRGHVQPDEVGPGAAADDGLGGREGPGVGPRGARLRHRRGGEGQRPRRQGGDADPGQEGGPHPAPHRPDQRHPAQRSGHGGGGRDGHRERRHRAHRRSGHEAQR